MLVNRLTNVLYRADKVRGYLDAFQSPFDTVRAALNVLKNDRWINTAHGVQLDGCGAIVNEPRNGRTDDEYRDAIRFKIFVNTSTATPGDINKAVSILTKPSEQHYWESYPACYLIFSNGPVVPEGIGRLLKDVSAAGIGVSAFMPSYSEPAFFLSSPSPRARLWAAGKRLKVNGALLAVGEGQAVDNGCYLGGISQPKLMTAGKRLKVGGKRLRINTQPHQTVIDGGSHLTGVYEI